MCLSWVVSTYSDSSTVVQDGLSASQDRVRAESGDVLPAENEHEHSGAYGTVSADGQAQVIKNPDARNYPNLPDDS